MFKKIKSMFLNELKYNTDDFINIHEGNIIVTFKGNVYVFDINDKSKNAIIKLTQLLNELCDIYYNMSYDIFNDFGKLKDIFTKENNKNIYDTIYNFVDCPKVLIGDIISDDDGLALSLYRNNNYDIANSKELYDLINNTSLKDYISEIYIDDKKIDWLNITKTNDVPIANPLYHGTITKYLYSILNKGLRKIQENSIFNVSNDGFVFLTSDYNIAKEYADMYQRKFGTQSVVLEIDSNHIDKNRIVLDYDFEQQFVGIGNKSTYGGNDIGMRKADRFKGKIADTEKSYGTQFAKIGYKGVIMPNAITNCFIYDNNGSVKDFTRNEYLMIKNKEKQNESINRINEIKASELNLSSFEVQDSLHNKFWIKDEYEEYILNSKVRLRLLDIADDFIDSMSVSWIKPVDIVFTGSLANYNWSKYSDIDIHIIYDFSKIYKKSEFVEDYFKSKKENWLNNHSHLKIYGFPVEISVEDSNKKNVMSGRYSLEKNEWITEPSDFQDAILNKNYIKEYSAKIMTEIDNIEKQIHKETDKHKIEVLSNNIEKIFSKIKNLRIEGLKSKKKEMSSGNIIYKLIRRMKYIDKIWDIVNYAYDKSQTITERANK